MRKSIPWLLFAAFTFTFGVISTIFVGGVLLHTQTVFGASSPASQVNSPSLSSSKMFNPASSVSHQAQSAQQTPPAPPSNLPLGPRSGSMMGGYGPGGPGWGMGPRPGFGTQTPLPPNASRITIDQAIDNAKQYVSRYYNSSDLHVTEAMEFSNNFYVTVKEISTGRGAFELLVDPYYGRVYPEMGPNMMWNVKYGVMGGWFGGGNGGDNTVTLDQAVTQAQQYLDGHLSAVKVEMDGTDFYGYYTFDYTVNGQTAGMMSVNGYTGQIWMHTWHGQFIAEKQVP